MSNNVICPICNKVIQNKQALKVHMMMSHGQDLTQEPEKIKKENSKIESCCEHEWRELTSMELRLEDSNGVTMKEHGYKFICIKCEELR